MVEILEIINKRYETLLHQGRIKSLRVVVELDSHGDTKISYAIYKAKAIKACSYDLEEALIIYNSI
jgi:hypothetical protein